MRFEKAFLIAMVLVLLQGCYTTLTVRSPSASVESSRVIQKNYVLHERSSTFVGNPMIKVSDYFVRETSSTSSYWIPNRDFKAVAYTAENIQGYAGQRFRELGDVFLEGVRYTALTDDRWHSAAVNGFAFLIDENGKPTGRVGPSGSQIMLRVYSFGFDPELTFSKVEDEVEKSIDTTKGYVNYEIIYNGISNDSMNLTYREYSPDDMARTAFFQNMTYPVGSETIRFRDLRIQVHSADSERIEFTVLED